ncbi:putative uncharacterized protein DDB_G0282133 isoform X2 [Monomorium pharaonis]|uniref:putative uncharacterized protein DDB_G0282133 isoform X2 n=1 Tax=Monomorium pharaonis TaxID=307658 RepID=UPI00102E12DC|nr:putative uncharacterized protein DDB_G0282133 isoform X2 [Monomorium pharaonis]
MRLDDITFRRSNRNGYLDFSTHNSSHQPAIKVEDVSLVHSEESETEVHQIEFRQDKSRKLQKDVNRIPTVFGERLHKKIMEYNEEEKKQKALLKLDAEVKTEAIPKNSNVENDKENGSQFSTNNNNECNIRRCSSPESPKRKKLVKRTNEEDYTYKHKRLKIESNENKTTTEETNHNYLTQYDQRDNPAQYEVKYSLVKSENRQNAAHFFKKEEAVLFHTERSRATSEYQDTKQDQSYTNGWKSKAKSNSTKDHDSSTNSFAYNLRNSRSASTSNYVSEEINNSYRKNGYRYSPSRRSYSRSRSDYESLSSRRLRERPSRTYREKKYDDYEYDSRHKNDWLKRNHDSEKNDKKTRYRSKECDHSRNKSRYSSSDAEDRESNSYKKKYENSRRKETINASSNKKLYENNKYNSQYKSDRLNRYHEENDRKTIYRSRERDDLRDKSRYSSSDAEDRGSNSSYKKYENHTIKKETLNVSNNKKPYENKAAKEINFRESSSLRTIVNSTPEPGEILDSPEKKINSTKISTDDTDQNNETIKQVHDSNINGADKNNYDERSNSIIETVIKIEKITDSNIESVSKIQKVDNFSIQSINKEKTNDSNIQNNVEVTEVNNFNNGNNNHEIDSDELRTSTSKVVTKVEAALNCDIEKKDESRALIKSETFHQTSNKTNVEAVCLDDHNNVQNSTNASDDLNEKPSKSSKCDENVPETAMSKLTKVEKTISVQSVVSVGVKRTMSSTVNNKDQSKGILISHRRKAVTLSDSNASMTVLMNTNVAKTLTSSIINNCNDDDSTLKPRACKISRVCVKATCK